MNVMRICCTIFDDDAANEITDADLHWLCIQLWTVLQATAVFVLAQYLVYDRWLCIIDESYTMKTSGKAFCYDLNLNEIQTNAWIVLIVRSQTMISTNKLPM